LGLIKTNRHNIDVIVDKLISPRKKLVTQGLQQRVQDDIEIALENSNGLAILTEVNDPGFDFPKQPAKIKDYLFSQRFACPNCNISCLKLSPGFFLLILLRSLSRMRRFRSKTSG
jgi:excinuclease ABC subunit A